METIRISVSPDLRGYIHGGVFRQPPFLWHPDTSNLKESQSFQKWRYDHTRPQIFVVTGHERAKADYFAAYLAQVHNNCEGLFWSVIDDGPIDEHYGHFRDNLKKLDEFIPSLIILTGLNAEPTDVQCERVRDIVHRFHVPIIVVGECRHGPVHLAGKLHLPAHKLCHVGAGPREIIEV